MKSKHAGENDEAIRAGYAANRRVSDIAADLGVTRNAVIGRARRLGLCDPRRLDHAIDAGYGAAALRAWHQAHPEHAEAMSETMQRWWKEHPEKREAASQRLKRVWSLARSVEQTA